MNAAARALTERSLATVGLKAFILSRSMLFSALLGLSILLSAFSMIYVQQLKVSLTNQVMQLQHNQDQLQARYSQLLLEKNSFLSQTRIEKIAEAKLNMQTPSKSIIIGESNR